MLPILAKDGKRAVNPDGGPASAFDRRAEPRPKLLQRTAMRFETGDQSRMARRIAVQLGEGVMREIACRNPLAHEGEARKAAEVVIRSTEHRGGEVDRHRDKDQPNDERSHPFFSPGDVPESGLAPLFAACKHRAKRGTVPESRASCCAD